MLMMHLTKTLRSYSHTKDTEIILTHATHHERDTEIILTHITYHRDTETALRHTQHTGNTQRLHSEPHNTLERHQDCTGHTTLERYQDCTRTHAHNHHSPRPPLTDASTRHHHHHTHLPFLAFLLDTELPGRAAIHFLIALQQQTAANDGKRSYHTIRWLFQLPLTHLISICSGLAWLVVKFQSSASKQDELLVEPQYLMPFL